jgi:hypothetical protein
MPARLVFAAVSLALGAGLATTGAEAHGGGGGGYTIFSSPGTLPHVAPHAPGVSPSRLDLADLQLKPLVAAGDPPSATAGDVTKGLAFFTVGVRHGVTGVLTSEVRARHWIFSDKPLPAGQAVYGVPMSGSDGAGMVWCAPARQSESGVLRWRAVCLPQNDGRFAWIEAKPALMTLNLAWIDGAEHLANAPMVERRSVDFPPMTLSYAFGGWNKDRWLVLDVRIDWGEGPQPLHSILVPPAADGSVDLHIMQGELTVRPGGAHGDDATVAVLSPPRPDAPIAY